MVGAFAQVCVSDWTWEGPVWSTLVHWKELALWCVQWGETVLDETVSDPGPRNVALGLTAGLVCVLVCGLSRISD